MSTSRGLHRRIDQDLVNQIEAHGKVRNRNKSLRRGIRRHFDKPEIKDRSFKGPVRKNQREDEYFK